MLPRWSKTPTESVGLVGWHCRPRLIFCPRSMVHTYHTATKIELTNSKSIEEDVSIDRFLSMRGHPYLNRIRNYEACLHQR